MAVALGSQQHLEWMLPPFVGAVDCRRLDSAGKPRPLMTEAKFMEVAPGAQSITGANFAVFGLRSTLKHGRHPACDGRVDASGRPWPSASLPTREVVSCGATDPLMLQKMTTRSGASWLICNALNIFCPRRSLYSRDAQCIATYLATNFDRLPGRVAFIHGHAAVGRQISVGRR